VAGDAVAGASALPPVPEGDGLAALVLTAPLVATPVPVPAPALELAGALLTAPLALQAATAATLTAAIAHASRRVRR
jgi:hypothetical protein